jgi:hypothetical protein
MAKFQIIIEFKFKKKNTTHLHTREIESDKDILELIRYYHKELKKDKEISAKSISVYQNDGVDGGRGVSFDFRKRKRYRKYKKPKIFKKI